MNANDNAIPDIKIDMPPHGHVRYIRHLGSDRAIVEAARVSYASGSKGEEADKKLLLYLYKNRHTSPFEQCSITFNIKLPIFLMRQFVRHRTFRLNGVSARYTELPDEFFLPSMWRAQDIKNRQGSVESSLIDQRKCDAFAKIAYDECYHAYQHLLELGASKEQARMVLPVGIYTEIFVNIDLHNLLHFLKLREDGHAQSEMRDVAMAMKQIAKNLFPWTFEAYERFKFTLTEPQSTDAP